MPEQAPRVAPDPAVAAQMPELSGGDLAITLGRRYTPDPNEPRNDQWDTGSAPLTSPELFRALLMPSPEDLEDSRLVAAMQELTVRMQVTWGTRGEGT